MISAKFSDSLTPPPLSAFGSDLYYKIHATSLTMFHDPPPPPIVTSYQEACRAKAISVSECEEETGGAYLQRRRKGRENKGLAGSVLYLSSSLLETPQRSAQRERTHARPKLFGAPERSCQVEHFFLTSHDRRITRSLQSSDFEPGRESYQL